jgi:hypothetical protein
MVKQQQAIPARVGAGWAHVFLSQDSGLSSYPARSLTLTPRKCTFSLAVDIRPETCR